MEELPGQSTSMDPLGRRFTIPYLPPIWKRICLVRTLPVTSGWDVEDQCEHFSYLSNKSWSYGSPRGEDAS